MESHKETTPGNRVVRCLQLEKHKCMNLVRWAKKGARERDQKLTSSQLDFNDKNRYQSLSVMATKRRIGRSMAVLLWTSAIDYIRRLDSWPGGA